MSSEYHFSIFHFAPISWKEIERNGFRKTSGATFKSLWDNNSVLNLWYVQIDRRWGFTKRIYEVDDKVTVIGLPIGLPFGRYDFIHRINRFIQSAILRAILKNKSGNKVYWFYDWLLADLVARLPKSKSVMELTDFASQFYAGTKVNWNRIENLKSIVRRNVDLIVSLSPSLSKEVEDYSCSILMEPNGISKEFIAIARKEQEIPELLKNIKKPKICVVGTQWSLNYRVNHELLLEACKIMPDWHFVLIGCERVESLGMKLLLKEGNVSVVGMVPQSELVPYIQHCDICAVPYLPCSGGYSLKLFEYLACGKPVVVTEDEFLSEFPYFSEFVKKIATPTDFRNSCIELVDGWHLKKIQDKINNMKDNTWDDRSNRILEVIWKIK